MTSPQSSPVRATAADDDAQQGAGEPPGAADPTSATWNDFVGVGLLGTDRRPTPRSADPAVADLVADAQPRGEARRLLVSVAATVVAERCGIVAAPPRQPVGGPPPDGRPMVSVAAAELWRRIAAKVPLLEPEWLELADANGWRPPPDVLVDLLRRAVGQPDRHAQVMRFGGDLAAWLVDTLPELGVPRPARRRTGALASAVSAASAVPPALLASFAGTPGDFATELVGGVLAGRYTWPQRLTLHHALAELPAGWLVDVLDAMNAARDRCPDDGSGVQYALWADLIEFAELRRTLHTELEIVR